MALFDFLKRKKQAEKSRKPAVEKKSGKKLAKTSVAKTEKPEPAAKVFNAKAKKGSFSYEAVRHPHISEKASYLSEKDQYIFKVLPDFNKKEVKNSVEGLYGVDVLSVNIIKIPAKKRRLGRVEGFKKGYKKAVVKIKNGQKIEIL